VNIQQNIETFITLGFIFTGLIFNLLIMRFNWKRYGALFLLSMAVGNILCYIFVRLGFYSFPYRLFPQVSIMPFMLITTMFPFIVLAGVRYSPQKWGYKIPFYWTIIHLGMLAETLGLNLTKLIEYNFKWDFWDSYTWWWIYLLIFEWIGGLLVPAKDRRPITSSSLRYGSLGWGIFHFILITTIFLGGVYLATVKN